MVRLCVVFIADKCASMYCENGAHSAFTWDYTTTNIAGKSDRKSSFSVNRLVQISSLDRQFSKVI